MYEPIRLVDSEFFTYDVKWYNANILIVLSTDFGSVTIPTVTWLYIVQSKTVFNLKLYSSIIVSVM